MKKKVWDVRITFVDPQDKEYIDELEEEDSIEKVEVIEK